jgi:hypothetical protein
VRPASLPFAIALTLALRLVAVLASDREVADVLRYQKVAGHVLDVSWDPYQAPRLYPYAPLWVWIEAGCGFLARRSSMSFAVLVKLPIVAADVAIVVLLARVGRRHGLGLLPAWAYAVHPVSLLVTGFHGQFDALPLLFVLLCLDWHEQARYGASGLALAAAIGWKPFPVLLVPVLAATVPPRSRLRFALLATAPVALTLIPFALHDLSALRRELMGYAGVADFGWIGVLRGVRFLTTGVLARSEAAHWPVLVSIGRWLFVGAFVLLAVAVGARRLVLGRYAIALAVFLAFLSLYGAVSAQYLLWVVPFGLLSGGRGEALGFAVAASVGLLGFYDFLAPGVLTPPSMPLFPRPVAGLLWVSGAAATLLLCWAWLARLVARGGTAKVPRP